MRDTMNTLTAVAQRLEIFADTAAAWIDPSGPAFTCTEADAIVGLLASTGRTETAGAVLLNHLGTDDHGDDHAEHHDLPVGKPANEIAEHPDRGMDRITQYVTTLATEDSDNA